MHGYQLLLTVCFLCYLKSKKIMLRLDMAKPYPLHIVTLQYPIGRVDLCMYSFHMIRE